MPLSHENVRYWTFGLLLPGSALAGATVIPKRAPTSTSDRTNRFISPSFHGSWFRSHRAPMRRSRALVCRGTNDSPPAFALELDTRAGGSQGRDRASTSWRVARLVVRFAVRVLERLDAPDHPETAPVDLARARVPRHVVWLA